jgi:uncharacterized protein (DUF488 family)
MIIYTIGFSGKSAEQFFTLLRESGTRRILDIRLNPAGQLSGFAKARDLPYFLKALCGIDYVYLPDFAPSAALLSGYRQATIDWPGYERIYRHEMETRAAEQRVSPDLLDGGCLLCSEALPGQCHRRLAAEYLSEFTPGLVVVHL